MKRILSILLLVCSVAAQAGATKTVVRQRWPWNTKVDIHYLLTDVGESEVGVKMTVDGGTTDVPSAALSGDFGLVDSGARCVSVDLAAAGLTEPDGYDTLEFDVSATPVYMVIDLAAAKAGGGMSAISYRGAPDNADGSWSDIYKTTKLVFRRVPACTFKMGSPVGEQGRSTGVSPTREQRRDITLTKPFWVSVFEVTQKQLEIVLGSRAEILPYTQMTNDLYYAKRPVDKVNYDNLRGTANGAKFPESGYETAVDDGSILASFRGLFNGEILFDLPTEAQWECACRAGSETAYCNGGTTAEDVNAYKAYATKVACYARAACSDRMGGLSVATAEVGSYRPNAWGIYDMHGNVYEWTRDWGVLSVLDSDQTTDPMWPSNRRYNPSYRAIRGGLYSSAYDVIRSAARGIGQHNGATTTHGIRLYAPVFGE